MEQTKMHQIYVENYILNDLKATPFSANFFSVGLDT